MTIETFKEAENFVDAINQQKKRRDELMKIQKQYTEEVDPVSSVYLIKYDFHLPLKKEDLADFINRSIHLMNETIEKLYEQLDAL